MALLGVVTITVFIVDAFSVGDIFLWLNIAFFLHVSVHKMCISAQRGILCCFKHTAVRASAAFCLLWRPYLFSQASSTVATLHYAGRNTCDRSAVNRTIFPCGPTAQAGPGPPHCSHFYTITQTHTHPVGRLHF
jgi:hypothetical protein